MGCVGHFQLDLLAQVVCVRERMGVDQGHPGDRSDAHRGMGVLSFTQGKGGGGGRPILVSSVRLILKGKELCVDISWMDICRSALS